MNDWVQLLLLVVCVVFAGFEYGMAVERFMTEKYIRGGFSLVLALYWTYILFQI